ncbi:MAG: Rieske 2Fe-2S domain-containing protein [Deltaproteobacteria bacterium]|nr:Rieske 2Fe-2S domain-containing protein [Deltaproteobacteria bacterium]MBW2394981.1 Rieske 2Fe-2S domain-containing protein [Deltaproteobacteria bacterium]
MAHREAEHVELPIPNGWFAVAFSRDLRIGDVQPLHYFDQDLVLFRGRTGEARVLDAYCPHLGAHLGHGGRVMGDTVRCPFHGWQFEGGSGECAHIPYCDRIPKKARVRPWDVLEKNGMVFVWHHVEGKPPEWDFPVQPEIGHPDWSEPRTFDLEVPVHVQDMHENNNDPVHFQYVHGMVAPLPSEIEFAEDGRYYRIVSTSEQVTPFGTFEMSLIRDSWGIGLSAVSSAGIPDAGLLMYSSTTPIDAQNTHSRWLLTATNNLVDLAGEEFMKNITAGVRDDLTIWTHKVHRARPVFCEADEYLAMFRKWTRQFYSRPASEPAAD